MLNALKGSVDIERYNVKNTFEKKVAVTKSATSAASRKPESREGSSRGVPEAVAHQPSRRPALPWSFLPWIWASWRLR